jgi:hypothetical protein
MRNKTAKLLRSVARLRALEMWSAGALNPPQSESHARHQVRQLYQGLKRVWKNSSHVERKRAQERWRQSPLTSHALQRQAHDLNESKSP